MTLTTDPSDRPYAPYLRYALYVRRHGYVRDGAPHVVQKWGVPAYKEFLEWERGFLVMLEKDA